MAGRPAATTAAHCERVIDILDRAGMTINQLAAALGTTRGVAERIIRILRERGEVAALNDHEPGCVARIFATCRDDIDVRRRILRARRIAYASSVFAWGARP